MRFPTGGKKAVVTGVAVVVALGAIVGAASLGDGARDGARSTVSGGSDDGFSTSAGSAAMTESGGGDSDAASGGGAALGVEATSGGVVDVSGALTPEELGGEGVSAAGTDVIKDATVEIDVGEADLDAARDRALSFVRGVGGFVESSRATDGTATMTFRVPAGDFEDVLSRMRELGEVTSEEVSGEDVSAEIVDLEARLRHWRAQEAAFLDLMEQTTTISETIEIRRELGTIQQQIEQIRGRMTFLEDRTSLSTLTVSLVSPAAGAAPPGDEGGGTLAEAWDQAWEAALSVVGGTLIVLGATVPLTVIVGIPGLVLWTALRRRRGRAAAPAA